MAQIINGKAVSLAERESIKRETEELLNKYGRRPGLAVIIVGEDPASKVYVANKEKGCDEVGFYSELYRLPENTEMSELLQLVDKLNKDDKINGILCQLPLPKHLNEEEVILAIDPNKDVDAFHPVNVGKIMIGNFDFLPCTPAGVMELLDDAGIELSGKNCVVIGRSNIVGKPQAMLLLHKNATVTICHSKTKNLKEICREADVLVVAVGRAKMVDESYIKEGAVVVDVGMDRDENGKLCGDVDFDSACKKASWITPVPGGVGPMTIATLMKNAVTAAEKTLK
jgi:methylenetetrahydrofolate dehydrogenase (NADP+)/methenyltetrahydrofolate cyclohydrolase